MADEISDVVDKVTLVDKITSVAVRLESEPVGDCESMLSFWAFSRSGEDCAEFVTERAADATEVALEAVRSVVLRPPRLFLFLRGIAGCAGGTEPSSGLYQFKCVNLKTLKKSKCQNWELKNVPKMIWNCWLRLRGKWRGRAISLLKPTCYLILNVQKVDGCILKRKTVLRAWMALRGIVL